MKKPSIEIGDSLLRRFGITSDLFQTNPKKHDDKCEDHWPDIFTLGHIFQQALLTKKTNNQVMRYFLDARMQIECHKKGLSSKTYH